MHYIKGLPFENPELINTKFEIKVKTLVGWELSQRYPETLNAVLDECRVDYHDAVNKAIQDFRFETQLHEREKLVAMQIFPLIEKRPPCPRQGCAPVEYDPEVKFKAIKRLIHDTLVIAELAMLFGLQLFHREYDISELSLVNPLLFTKERPMLWPYFPPLQDSWCTDRTEDLKATWMGNVVGLVEEIIPPNRVTDRQRDHVRRFAYRLHYTMTQHLRDVVLNSVASFTKIWDTYTIKENEVDDDLDDYQDPAGPPVAEPEFQKPPMFRIKLAVDWEDQFIFVPTLEEMTDIILIMLDEICDRVSGVEDLVSRLDPKIVGVEKVQDIRTIPRDHPRVEAQRNIIKVLPGNPSNEYLL